MPENVQWCVRGIRGATTVEQNSADSILTAAKELLDELVVRNGIQTEDIASAFFSTTRDLDADFPAAAARIGLGWEHVALMCGHEMDVPGSLRYCLRVLLHVNTLRSQSELDHVYLHGAQVLRPDFSNKHQSKIKERY